MLFRIGILASLATASSLLCFAQPVSAQYSKICATNNGGYVAEYKLDLGGISTGFNSGTAIGATKCYTGADAYGSNTVPANSTFKLYTKAQGGETITCVPDELAYSATGGTKQYTSRGTTDNVTCH